MGGLWKVFYRKNTLVLCVIFSVGLFLRLWGNTYGLPDQYAPDEGDKISIARSLPQCHYLHKASQPSFLYYSVHLLLRVTDPVRPALKQMGIIGGARFPEAYPLAFDLWLGRCWIAILSTLTLWFVYRIGRESFGQPVGTVAALLLAFAPVSIATGQYIKEDTPLALWTTATLWLSLRYLNGGRLRNLIAAAVVSGVACGSKYPGAASILVVLASILIRQWNEKDGQGLHARFIRRAAGLSMAVVIGFCVGFTITCLVLVLNIPQILSGLSYQTKYLAAGHHDGISIGPWGQGWTFYLRKAVGPGMGWPAALAAAFGLHLAWRKSKPVTLILGGWAIAYILVAEAMPAKPYPFFARYILPAVPPLCVLAAVALAHCARTLRQSDCASPLRRVLGAVLLASLIPMFFLSAVSVLTALPDTREQADRWAREHLPPESVVFLTTYSPSLSSAPFEVLDFDAKTLAHRRQAAKGNNIYVFLSSYAYQRYLDHPRSVPKMTKLYRSLLKVEHGPEATFVPRWPSMGFHNPKITIIRLEPQPESALPKQTPSQP